MIENTQRDLNIALMNELAILFDKIGIDTLEVLQAAGTKWNFLPFRPGLVGGHCIGVDPYYLTHKADMVGYHPQVILAGRRINDGMGKFIAEQTVKHMIRKGSPVKGAKVNVLGLTFKEDCPDIRNTRVIDVIHELKSYGIDVHVHDPVCDADEARHEYGLELEPWDALPRADAIVVAVAHRQFVGKPLADYLAKVVGQGCFHRRQGQVRPEGVAAGRDHGLALVTARHQKQRARRGTPFLARDFNYRGAIWLRVAPATQPSQARQSARQQEQRARFGCRVLHDREPVLTSSGDFYAPAAL